MEYTLLSLISGAGLGAVITAFVQYWLNRRETTLKSQRNDLEARYRVVILLMYAVVNFADNRASLRINRPDLKTREQVIDELEAE